MDDLYNEIRSKHDEEARDSSRHRRFSAFVLFGVASRYYNLESPENQQNEANDSGEHKRIFDNSRDHHAIGCEIRVRSKTLQVSGNNALEHMLSVREIELCRQLC